MDLRPFFKYVRKITNGDYCLYYVCLSCLSAGNILAPTEQLFMKFYLSIFLKSVEKAQAIEIWATLCEGLCTGVLISPYPDLFPDVRVFCWMVRIFRLMLVVFYIYIYIYIIVIFL